MRRTLPVSFLLVISFLIVSAPLLLDAQQLDQDVQKMQQAVSEARQKYNESQERFRQCQGNTICESSAGQNRDLAQQILQNAQKALEEYMRQQAMSKGTPPLTKSNEMCIPVKQECGCNKVLRCAWGVCSCVAGDNKLMCQCKEVHPEVPGLVIDGFCVADGICLAQTFTDLQGQKTGVGDVGNVIGDIFKGLLDKLMGGGGGGSGGGSPGGSQGCTQYYNVTVPSSDPCAIYVPPISGNIFGQSGTGASQQLLNALGSGSQSPLSSALGSPIQTVSSQLTNFLQGTQGTAQTTGGAQTTSTASQSTSLISGQTFALQSGTRGDIQLTGTGATIFAGSRDEQAGTEVAGFFGGDTFGTQPQTMAARLCQSRPWAGSFVSYIIPPTFFDGLCSWRGYQVGTPAPAPYATPAAAPQQTSQPTPASAGATTSPAIPTIEPKVDIWAIPASVPIGARTSIFWNTQGVSSCAVTSPDGSFFESSLTGGAATVPITGATVFTISCLAPDGTPVTDFFTVNLAI